MRYVDLKIATNVSDPLPDIGHTAVIEWGCVSLVPCNIAGHERVMCVETIKDSFGYLHARVWIS
jgi:hypothetical protein